MAENKELMFMLGEMNGKLDGINTRLDKLNGRTEKTEEKVQTLEKDRAKVYGVVAGVTSVLSIGWAFVTGLLK